MTQTERSYSVGCSANDSSSLKDSATLDSMRALAFVSDTSARSRISRTARTAPITADAISSANASATPYKAMRRNENRVVLRFLPVVFAITSSFSCAPMVAS